MAMQGGTVTINEDGSYDGTGLAKAIFLAIHEQRKSQLAAISDAFNNSLSTPGLSDAEQAALKSQRDAQVVALLRLWASDANALGPAIVTYIQANAAVSLTSVKATVSTSASVGTVPNPVVAGDPIDPPGTAVDLPVTGAGGATEIGIT